MFKHKNLMMMMMKLMKICCAAVLALGLAACGEQRNRSSASHHTGSTGGCR